MAEVKQITIETETETETSPKNENTDAENSREKTLVTRMREIAESALDTIKSEVKKEIEERISTVEETATNVTSEAKKEVEAIIQRVRDQFEIEREELLREEIEKEVATAVEKVHEEYKGERDLLLRTAAEAENTKKRLHADYQRQLKFANEDILEGMIPVLDSLGAAIKSVNEQAETDDAPAEFTSFNEGVQLVHKQLLDALKIHGVTPIEAVGEIFDPNQHEALLITPSDDVPEGKVIEEFRRGYMLHTRVLRASQVVVSQGPAENDKTDRADDTDETATTQEA